MTDLGLFLATDFMSGFAIDEEPLQQELYIDESLSPVDRFLTYARSDLVLHRLYVVRELMEIVQQLDYDSLRQHVLPYVEALGCDLERSVRDGLLSQAAPLAAYLASSYGELGFAAILQYVLPVVFSNMRDRVSETQILVHSAIVDIAQHLRPEEVKQHLWPALKQLTHVATEEEDRIQAASLLGEIATLLGAEFTAEQILPEFLSLCSDSLFRVRKACAEHMPRIGAASGSALFQSSLLPVFLQLCQDDVWGVRKACVDHLHDISPFCSAKERRETLTPLLLQFTQDTSRWVRLSTQQIIGPFIATFSDDEEELPSSLIQSFLRLEQDDRSHSSVLASPTSVPAITGVSMNAPGMASADETEGAFLCAFNFPAVMLTLGATQWPVVRETYQHLCRSVHWKVRRTLACSLHEMARILGPNEATVELWEPFERFLSDLEEVRSGVIEQLALFLSFVLPEKRELFLTQLPQLLRQQDGYPWRPNECIASQLGRLSELYDPESVYLGLTDTALSLLRDPVAAVRQSAARGVAEIYVRLHSSGDGDLAMNFSNHLLGLSNDASYNGRKLFVQMCAEFMRFISLADLDRLGLMPALLRLADDRVPNVRLALGRVLQFMQYSLAYAEDPRIIATLTRLRADDDRDVRDLSQGEASSNPDLSNGEHAMDLDHPFKRDPSSLSGA